MHGDFVARGPFLGLLWIGDRGRASLPPPPVRRCSLQNVDVVQVAGGLDLSLVEVVVGHADVIQLLGLACA